MDPLNRLRENLITKKEEAGFSNRELSLKANLSEGTVGKILNNKSTSYPRIDTILQLATVFKCSLDELVLGDGSESVNAELST